MDINEEDSTANSKYMFKRALYSNWTKGAYAQALDMIDKALNENVYLTQNQASKSLKDTIELYWYRHQLNLKLYEFKYALGDLTAITEKDPHNGPAYLAKARLLAKIGRYADAALQYNQFINLRTLYVPSFLERASVLDAEGSTALAVQDYKTALKYDPSNQTALLSLAEYYFSKTFYNESIKFYSRILEVTDNYKSFIQRARAHAFCEKFEDSLNDLNMAIKLFPVIFAL